jgi:hypothetical protein
MSQEFTISANSSRPSAAVLPVLAALLPIIAVVSALRMAVLSKIIVIIGTSLA